MVAAPAGTHDWLGTTVPVEACPSCMLGRWKPELKGPGRAMRDNATAKKSVRRIERENVDCSFKYFQASHVPIALKDYPFIIHGMNLQHYPDTRRKPGQPSSGSSDSYTSRLGSGFLLLSRLIEPPMPAATTSPTPAVVNSPSPRKRP